MGYKLVDLEKILQRRLNNNGDINSNNTMDYNFVLENLALKKFDSSGITFYDKQFNMNIVIDEENLTGLVEILLKLFPEDVEEDVDKETESPVWSYAVSRNLVDGDKETIAKEVQNSVNWKQSMEQVMEFSRKWDYEKHKWLDEM